ncbi:PDZ domain-containing protein [Deinococcus sp. VB343]|uniref:PDZ domain-containing protein n=1 Tax=unclassified Deinococcus TaxID=2623546 RepID=UPI0030CEB543
MKKLLPIAALCTSLACAAPIKGTSLSGKIMDWPADLQGELQLMDEKPVPVGADGTFTLPLPKVDAAKIKLGQVREFFSKPELFGDTACQGTGTATPTDAQYTNEGVFVLSGGKDYGDIVLRSKTRPDYGLDDAGSWLMYFTRPTTLKGQLTCGFATFKFSGTFEAGWNLVRLQQTKPWNTWLVQPNASTSDLQWYLFTEYGGVGLQSKTNDAGEVVVSTVSKGGAAEKAGVLVGDVILSVAGQPKPTLTQVGQALRGAPDTPVTVTVRRAGRPQPLSLTLRRTRIRFP